MAFTLISKYSILSSPLKGSILVISPLEIVKWVNLVKFFIGSMLVIGFPTDSKFVMFIQFCMPVKSLIFLFSNFKVPVNPTNCDLVIIWSSFLLLSIALFNTALKLESGISTTASLLNPKGVISRNQELFLDPISL